MLETKLSLSNSRLLMTIMILIITIDSEQERACLINCTVKSKYNTGTNNAISQNHDTINIHNKQMTKTNLPVIPIDQTLTVTLNLNKLKFHAHILLSNDRSAGKSY